VGELISLARERAVRRPAPVPVRGPAVPGPTVLGSAVPGTVPVRTAARGPAAGRDPLWRELSGGVLRAERRRQDRTLADVAGRAGMSVQHLSEMERGRKEASSEMLAAAAGALGLGLAEFVRRCALTMAGAGAGAGADADADAGAGATPTGPVLLAA
jgi:hypothetical protein